MSRGARKTTLKQWVQKAAEEGHVKRAKKYGGKEAENVVVEDSVKSDSNSDDSVNEGCPPNSQRLEDGTGCACNQGHYDAILQPSSTTPAATATPPPPPKAEPGPVVCDLAGGIALDGFECSFLINSWCAKWIDSGHLDSKSKQLDFMERCMEQDCEQSLQGSSSVDARGCRYLDEHGFCYGSSAAQEWCRLNPTSAYCSARHDGGIEWAVPPLGQASDRITAWHPRQVAFKGQGNDGSMSCRCMKDCSCTGGSSPWKCTCASSYQTPVGPGLLEPISIVTNTTR